jgi:hypothetical protein
MTKREKLIIDAARKLIEAMQSESQAMPVSHEAPKTVEAAGILLSRLLRLKT